MHYRITSANSHPLRISCELSKCSVYAGVLLISKLDILKHLWLKVNIKIFQYIKYLHMCPIRYNYMEKYGMHIVACVCVRVSDSTSHKRL